MRTRSISRSWAEGESSGGCGKRREREFKVATVEGDALPTVVCAKDSSLAGNFSRMSGRM